MQTTRFKNPFHLAIASIASPFVITGLTILYLNRSNLEFWKSLGPGDSHAAALGAFSELIVIGFFLFLGSGIGLLLNGYSIHIQKRSVWYNRISTIINSAPFAIFFAAVLISKISG